MNRKLAIRSISIIFCMVLIAIVIAIPVEREEHSNTSNIGGEFVLTNQYNEKFNSQKLLGKHSIIFFGFTNCPAVCPNGLAVISQAAKQLPFDYKKHFNLVFITVDPKRDNVSTMKNYMDNFSANFIALTGSELEIQDVLDKYKIYASKVPMHNGEYMMNHSSYIYIMDKKGNFINHFNYNVKLEELKKELIELVN